MVADGKCAESVAVEQPVALDLPLLPFFDFAAETDRDAGEPEKQIGRIGDLFAAGIARFHHHRFAMAKFLRDRIHLQEIDRRSGKIEEWQQWEVECYRLLNGDAFRAFTVGNHSVCLEKVPGRSLWDYMVEGTLTRQMMQAGAREFRRVHQLWSGEFEGPWSHGDATMQNVIYDAKTDRARLIDFEIVHEKSLPPAARHADDLVVCLLDLVAKGRIRKWLPLAVAFLETYGVRDVLAEINQRLVIPAGLARIWWNVRTSFANTAKVKRRIQLLRNAAATLQVSSTVGLEPARKRRRPSTICHTISPGMPSANSRTLAMSERAKAAPPAMPRRLPTTR